MQPLFQHRSSHGFTLVEVLIALSLSVILAALLFSSLHTYALGAAAGQQHLARKQVGESVYQFIRDQLRETVPLTFRVGSERIVLFHGAKQQIAYIGRIPSHRSIGGLHRNSLIIDGRPPHQALIFSYSRLNVDNEFNMDEFIDSTVATTRTLIEDANVITFEYFGTDQEDAEPGWSDEWSVDNRLPQLVRIRIDRSDSRSVDDIVVPIYAHVISTRTALNIGTPRPTAIYDLLRQGLVQDRRATKTPEQQPR